MLRSHCRTTTLPRLIRYAPPSFRPPPINAVSASRHYLHTAQAVRFHGSPTNSLWRAINKPSSSLGGRVGFSRGFHSSHRNEGFHLLAPLVVGVFKSSTSINFILGAVRVALTLIPMALLGKHSSHKWLRKIDRTFKDNPEMQAYKPRLMRRLRFTTIAIRVLLLVPAALFGLVVLASIERTPLTGRLRLIILSADEEEGIARDLSGPGWFTAINDVLTTPRGPPKFIPPSDWRYKWVERVLRRLESSVPALQDESRAGDTWFARRPEDPPYPPPSDYPLVPRPRVAQSLHYFEPRHVSEHQKHHLIGDVPPRSVLGPPYSLLVNDQPDQSNAFSYGFGPNGSGGVVIFSGFLDEIIRNTGGMVRPVESRGNSIPGLLARLFSPSKPSLAPPIPTPEQDAQLAILVAHELSHLLLSHHLETLSSGEMFWPGLASILADLLRAVLYPVTMVGGPFINDALEQVGEIGKREFSSAADTCSSHLMEIEADVVSIRLLALAGWDARAAVDFWEARINAPTKQFDGAQEQAHLPGVLPGSLWVSQDGDVRSASHPVDAVRVKKLREELSRWEAERERARARTAEKTVAGA